VKKCLHDDQLIAHGGLQVSKKVLPMTYVDQAAEWAKALTRTETRGPGDQPGAWRRLEARYGISAHTFWSLRYRKPQDIAVSIYMRLQAAYQAECERQMRQLEHEIEITKAIAGPNHPAVVAAETLVGEEAQ
jgi:hypothetical protein